MINRSMWRCKEHSSEAVMDDILFPHPSIQYHKVQHTLTHTGVTLVTEVDLTCLNTITVSKETTTRGTEQKREKEAVTERMKRLSTHTYTHTHLLSSLLLPLVLRGLQHLFFPQHEEVGGVCVELQRILLIIPGGMERERREEERSKWVRCIAPFALVIHSVGSVTCLSQHQTGIHSNGEDDLTCMLSARWWFN
jgi:hypothetical protein